MQKFADFMPLKNANSEKVEKIGMVIVIINIPQNAKKKAVRTGKSAKKCTQLRFVNSIWKENAPETTAFF